jgi:hypothetical protein
MMGAGGWRKKNLDDFEAWYHALPPDAHVIAAAGRDAMRNAGRWRGYIDDEGYGHANTYEITRADGVEVLDFTDRLADPACYGSPKWIDSKDAYLYLGMFDKFCKRAGVPRAEFVDMRHRNGGVASDFEEVYAYDCPPNA